MERAEADAIYEQGRGMVVAVLLRMDAQIKTLSERVAKQEERIAQLERRLGRDSRNIRVPVYQATDVLVYRTPLSCSPTVISYQFTRLTGPVL